MTPMLASATPSSAEQCTVVQSVPHGGEEEKKNCTHASLKSFYFYFYILIDGIYDSLDQSN